MRLRRHEREAIEKVLLDPRVINALVDVVQGFLKPRPRPRPAAHKPKHGDYIPFEEIKNKK